jgi:mono/diheme cytochrome c family protein
MSPSLVTSLFGLLIVAGQLATADVPPAVSAVSADQADFFERRVRPILAEHCWSCHGEKKQQAGLRLDSRAAAIKGSDNGPILVPGKPDDSQLVEAIRHVGDLKMPPKGKLPDDAIAALTEWVRLGVPWPASSKSDAARATDAWKTHWAFQPVRDPALPTVRHTAWPRAPIDHFILAQLETHGFAPSLPAEKPVLLRRVTFDLIGLPPTPEEVAAFEADQSPDAFARVVDRLLASLHYGERWARHWLDIARYADSKGYVFFEDARYPWAYTYRDWVIRAFNDDLPYDQFIIKQLAADLLHAPPIEGGPEGRQTALGDRSPLTPSPSPPGGRGGYGSSRDLAALGFVTCGNHYMNNVHDILDDRIDVVTRGLLGLTVGCARCHDHKFDPIPTADYYSLYGVFRSASEPLIPPLLDPSLSTPEYAKFDTEMQKRQRALDEFVTRKYDTLVGEAKSRLTEYLLAANATKDQPSTENFMLLVNEGDLNPAMLQRWWILLDKSRKGHDPVWAPWHAFAALPSEEFANRAADVCSSLPLPQASKERRAVNPLVLQAVTNPAPQSLKEVAQRYSELLNRVEDKWQRLVKLAVGDRRARPERLDDPAEEELRLAFHGADAPPNVPKSFGWGFLTLLPDRPSQGVYQKLLKDLESWAISGPGAPPRAMVLVDDPIPHDPRIFLRGNPNREGEFVPRQFLSAISAAPRKPFTHGSGRLELARAIADPANPLTARVLVNRVWHHHFGTGLVRTLGDFGMRCDPPSHPELLDHLATTFVREGWSIKKLHKAIVLSATYQQASGVESRESRVESESPSSQLSTLNSRLSTDPDNRWLSRFPRRRLDFESTRDALLAVSGSLDRTVGGPPVDITGGFTPRRTVYGYLDRMNLPSLFRTFDFPSPESSSPQRDQTTVAPQALFLMNNVFAFEAAKRLTLRPDVVSLPTPAERVTRIYRHLFSRAPTATELQAATDYLGGQPTADQWTRYAHALLLTNEFVFVD